MTRPLPDHIDIGAIFESVRGQAPLEAAAKAHLDACQFCRGRLNWMELTAELGAQDRQFEIPESMVGRAVALGRRAAELKSGRTLIEARLTFDSFGNESPQRRLSYEGGAVEINVILSRDGSTRWKISGEVRFGSAGGSSAELDLVMGGDHVATARLNDSGEFEFGDLPDTRYALHVYFAGGELVRTALLPALHER